MLSIETMDEEIARAGIRTPGLARIEITRATTAPISHSLLARARLHEPARSGIILTT